MLLCPSAQSLEWAHWLVTHNSRLKWVSHFCRKNGPLFWLKIHCTVLKCFRALLPKHLKGFNEENKISMSRHTLQESLQKVLKLCTTCAFKGIHLSLINVYQCLKARSFIILGFWTLSSIHVENKNYFSLEIKPLGLEFENWRLKVIIDLISWFIFY